MQARLNKPQNNDLLSFTHCSCYSGSSGGRLGAAGLRLTASLRGAARVVAAALRRGAARLRGAAALRALLRCCHACCCAVRLVNNQLLNLRMFMVLREAL